MVEEVKNVIAIVSIPIIEVFMLDMSIDEPVELAIDIAAVVVADISIVIDIDISMIACWARNVRY